jgi:hypothetical protein
MKGVFIMFKLNKNMVVSIINEAVASMNWGSYKVEIGSDLDSFSKLFGLIGKGAGSVGVAGTTDFDNHVVTFYSDFIVDTFSKGLNGFTLKDTWKAKAFRFIFCGNKSPEEILKRSIYELVAHENRHCQQMDWLQANHPEIVMDVVNAEKKSIYGLGVMERDAYRYQSKKVHVPFEKVFKKFIKNKPNVVLERTSSRINNMF